MSYAIAPYRPEQFDQVDALWRACFPGDPPHNSAAAAIPPKLEVQPELFLVAEEEGAEEEGRVIGTVMAGWDGHRGWLYAVAVDPARRRGGVGRALVRAAEAGLAALGCGKVNLQVRAENAGVAAFYEGLGYAVEARVSMGKRLGGLGCLVEKQKKGKARMREYGNVSIPQGAPIAALRMGEE